MSATGPNVTKWFIIITILVIVTYDLFAIWWWGQDAAISIVAYEACCDHPVLTAGLFFVLGHIFWPLGKQ